MISRDLCHADSRCTAGLLLFVAVTYLGITFYLISALRDSLSLTMILVTTLTGISQRNGSKTANDLNSRYVKNSPGTQSQKHVDQSIDELLGSLSMTSWSFFAGQLVIIASVFCVAYSGTVASFFYKMKGQERKGDALKLSSKLTQIQPESTRSPSQVALTQTEPLSEKEDPESLHMCLEAAIKLNENAEVIDFVRLVGKNPAVQERYSRLLRCAVLEDNEFVLRFLLENAIDPLHPDFDLESILWLSVELSVKTGHQGPTKLLLTYIPEPSVVVEPLVEFAARENYLPLLDSLWPLYLGADFPCVNSILWDASYLGHTDIVNFFISRICTDRNSLDISLHAAVFGSHVDLVKLLLNRGASARPPRILLPSSTLSLLHTAAANANTAIVSMLLNRGAKLHLGEKNKAGPLQVALHSLNFPVYELLRARGANELAIPLSTAVHARHKELIVKLLQHGACWMQYCGMFGSLLQMVCTRGDEEMAGFLISCGFSVDPDSPVGLGGNSPLMAAVSSGNHKLVELLISQGASIQRAQSEYGNALQTAVFLGHLEIARILLENSFDVRSQRGPLPDALTIAVRKWNRDMASLLLQKGASTRSLGKLDHFALIRLMQ